MHTDVSVTKSGCGGAFLEGLVRMMDSADLEGLVRVVMQILNKKRKFCKNG